MDTRLTEPRTYVRIASTTLYVVPYCYGNWSESCDKITAPCPVREQCMAGVKTEIRMVEIYDK